MKSEIPNDYKEDFFHIGERVGKFNKDHPDQIIQEVWENWKDEYGNLGNWYEAFQNWRRGFLVGFSDKN